MCAKFGSDRFRNVDLYKVQTNLQTFIFIYKMYNGMLHVIYHILCVMKYCYMTIILPLVNHRHPCTKFPQDSS